MQQNKTTVVKCEKITREQVVADDWMKWTNKKSRYLSKIVATGLSINPCSERRSEIRAIAVGPLSSLPLSIAARLHCVFYYPRRRQRRLPYPNCMVIRTRCKHPFVPWIPRHRVNAAVAMARKRLKEWLSFAVPDIHITILTNAKYKSDSNIRFDISLSVYGARRIVKHTFASADYKIAVNAAKTTPYDVFPLALSCVPARQSSWIEIPQVYFLFKTKVTWVSSTNVMIGLLHLQNG